MQLSQLLKGIKYEILQGKESKEINSIAWNLNEVKPKSLFICVRGESIDRHDYALKAIYAGATVLIVEHQIQNVPRNITIIKVDDVRDIMACIASTFYGEPSNSFNLIGVTGTNGKTSISYFIATILKCIGRKVGVIGTIDNTIEGKTLNVSKLNPTTPDAIELQASFKEMLDENVTDVVMEVTSIALQKQRVEKCNFDVGVFTNLTHDHLDAHGSMDAYKAAKMKLFKMCKNGIVNADDAMSIDIKNNVEWTPLTYAIENEADFKALNIRYHMDGVNFELDYHGDRRNIKFNLQGKFNIYNLLAAIGACYLLGFSLDEIISGVEQIEVVKGRCERVYNKDYQVIIDYAHTPDALENILISLRELTDNRVIVVFGCEGDKDKIKRSIMGHIAGTLSDFCILTSDNPRTEEPLSIIKDIELGIIKSSGNYTIIENRKNAIFKALSIANKGDIIIIAGKGHEKYQICRDYSIPFNDECIVKEYFQSMN